MIQRILALVKKEFLHLRGDWWLPAFMLLGGAMELLLVGWATSRPITNLPMMVWDQDRSAQSRAVVQALENTGTFQLEAQVHSYQTLEAALVRGDINAAVIIPPDYARQLLAPEGKPTLGVILNGAESLPATEAKRAVQGVVRDLGEEIALTRYGLDRGLTENFLFSLRVWFNETLSEAYYTTPAELGLMLEFTILLFAALTFSREREFGTLEQLLVMPFSSLDIILGKSLPVILVGMADFSLMLGVVHFAFDVPVRGSLPLLFILALGYTMVELGKGMFISVISRNQHQAFLLVFMVGMIDFMFTGYAAPVESMPRVLQLTAQLVPAHHWLNILRGLLLKGAGLPTLWPSIAALAGLGAVITIISLRYIRRALD